MILNFIFSHLNIIVLALWVIFLGIIVMHFIRPALLKNIHFGWLVAAIIALHLFYGVFVTWGQYHVWAIGSSFTKMLVFSPLPQEAPLPSLLEWMRPFFSHSLGYFAYYAFGRIWLNIIELFVVTGFLYLILKLWSSYRGGFRTEGPEIIAALLLIAGFPNILILTLLGFLVAIAWLGFRMFNEYTKNKTYKVQPVYLEAAFLFATPISLIFGNVILNKLFHILYTIIR